MKKPDLAKQIAIDSGVTEAEAADRLDKVVHDILASLRSGKTAALPGLGSFKPGDDGKVKFRREGTRRRG
jgi:nucleoid DNA-binding protein